MDFSEENFKELDEELKIKENDFKILKQSILTQATQKKRSIKPFMIAIATAFVLLVASPMYSPVMANLAAKIVPIEIYPSFTLIGEDTQLTMQLHKLLTTQGYDVNSVGVVTASNLVEISIISEGLSSNQVVEQVATDVETVLAENGYDLYDVKYSVVDAAQQEKSLSDKPDLYVQVSAIVKEVFAKNGYALEADNELAGLRKTWFSHILLLDMPDHIKESKEIVADIQTEIDKQALDIKDIKITPFNYEHRIQENRWAYLASDIYDAMAGKSSYQLSGLSYSVKKGHAYVSIKTNWSKEPSETVVNKMIEAVQKYLELPETKNQLLDDAYTIQFLNVEGEAFIKISNSYEL